MRHYLNFSDLTAAECASVLAHAAAVKREVKGGVRRPRLEARQLFMVLEKPSTRTRASFAAAMTQAGGRSAELSAADLHLRRGETTADTARALSSYADALMLRVSSHDTLSAFAAAASCPVINGLSDLSHPCQVLADVMTYQELRGELSGRVVAWFGDCNNVLYSWAEAAAMFGCRLRVCCPPAYRRDLPPAAEFVDEPLAAARGADLLMTDVWMSMGDTDERQRYAAFADYQVTTELLAAAAPDALFMHCLPAHRGEEVAAEVIDGEQSAVWTQAENRLHAQKALLIFLLGADEAEEADE